MGLTRVWLPSPNYSGGGTKRLLVLHTTEGFTGSNGAYDCAVYFSGNVGASSQVCIDNNRGKIYECVSRSNGAWTQCNYNSVSVSAEQCGYASWSRDYWLSSKSNLLHNTADWLAEESKKFGIPLVKLSSGSAQGSGRGVCYHSDLGGTGCGHSDPGSNYPINEVLSWAGGSTSTPPPSGGGGSAPTLHVDYFGTDHNSTCGDVQPWQQKMYDRGWHEMLVDGDYGPISKDICLSFQSEKGLSVDGYVGPETWNATWNAPVT
jgi:peptidoglycan hydrolase-like protein with peptidoglycan-binding domain